MSDILNAVNSIKPLIQALDGLRLLTPVLEKLGSLENAEKELTAIKQAEQIKCEEAKEELRKTNVDLTAAKTQLKDLTKKIKDQCDEKIHATDLACALKIKVTNEKCDALVADTDAKTNSALLFVNKSNSKAAEELKVVNAEIVEKQKTLDTLRETIAKIAGV